MWHFRFIYYFLDEFLASILFSAYEDQLLFVLVRDVVFSSFISGLGG